MLHAPRLLPRSALRLHALVLWLHHALRTQPAWQSSSLGQHTGCLLSEVVTSLNAGDECKPGTSVYREFDSAVQPADTDRRVLQAEWRTNDTRCESPCGNTDEEGCHWVRPGARTEARQLRRTGAPACACCHLAVLPTVCMQGRCHAECSGDVTSCMQMVTDSDRLHQRFCHQVYTQVAVCADAMPRAQQQRCQ